MIGLAHPVRNLMEMELADLMVLKDLISLDSLVVSLEEIALLNLI